MVQFNNVPSDEARDSIRSAVKGSYWILASPSTAPVERLDGDRDTDLVVVGAGFTGLWTAILAKQAEPHREVIVVDGGTIANGASGRNGGFVSASITHGFPNGLARWPDELPELLRLGRENLDAIETFIREHDISCDFLRSGELSVAVAEHQVAELAEATAQMRAHGEHEQFLDAQQTRARVNSPTYLASSYDEDGVALVDPVRLANGLADAARELGVQILERTPVRAVGDAGQRVEVRCDSGVISAARVVLATNAFPPLLRRLKSYIVPVYDYVLMTEPLTDAQWSAVGWSGREGVADVGNRFHYYRTTEDGRILWGGYDAVYHYGNGFGPHLDHDEESYARLAGHFFQTFPQLRDVRFSHTWGGAIDTCSRFTAFWGTALDGKLGYVLGFTGLGVGASRFGAQTVLDLVDGRETERTALKMVRTKPLPFPPEPLRSAGISLTTKSLDRADVTGRRNLWLRSLDRMGMGFDS